MESESKGLDSLETTNESDEEDVIMDPMEFMPPIEANSYYGIAVGQDITQSADVLFPGSLKTGEGVFDVHYMLFQKDTLGYVYGLEKIESIHIWDGRGATPEGIRVGTTFGEAKQLLKNIAVQGSEMESRVYIVRENHSYRLAYNSTAPDIDPKQIPDTVKIQEIIIR